jgi:hypothetical protein
VRDGDAKFTLSFDEVVRADGIQIIRTPVRAPRANTFVINAWHLERVFRSYARRYKGHCARSQGLSQPIPVPTLPSPKLAAMPVQPSCSHRRHVHRRDRFGGLIHEYELAA